MSQSEVRLLYMNIDPEKISPATLERWLAQLPARKRDQIGKHRHHANRVQSAAGWRLVEQAMRDLGFADFSLEAVDFASPHKSGSAFPADFNISHSGQLVCAAALRNGRIGIDVEQFRPLKSDVIHKYLTPAQARQCETDPNRFFDFWTQKEAVVKAHGQEGIARLREVELHDGKAHFADKTWYLTPLSLADGYVGHIATDLSSTRLEIEQIDSDQVRT
ncbi:4'-phosphopantetheinyl transferase family protein [Thiohalophilus sp.]|uniref:4'-phosphopantetheinyl transferase family protein n=1 Tax=Thiohalophilus sp. TaxID=3028392 RepID=UPI002ACD40EA|nr:4'-phosphopantetheinyl transferase superfamily protein [Thiohalophilus sp.]MDZ7661193.1 4'-phosphopantetheinyl transferase superfamily protein [Thiohalophilus sp.]